MAQSRGNLNFSMAVGIMANKVRAGLFLAALFGVVLFAFVYFLGSHGEAFEFVEQKIKNSHMIESQIGKIKRIRLDPFGRYEEKSTDSDERVRMTVEVIGAAKTIVLEIKAKKTNGTWEIEQALDGGIRLPLD
jgi:hypothetical protein